MAQSKPPTSEYQAFVVVVRTDDPETGWEGLAHQLRHLDAVQFIGTPWAVDPLSYENTPPSERGPDDEIEFDTASAIRQAGNR